MMLRPLVIAALLTLAATWPAAAYIGPGSGLSAIGSVLALVGALLLAIIGFVFYPVRRLLRRRRAARQQAARGQSPAHPGT